MVAKRKSLSSLRDRKAAVPEVEWDEKFDFFCIDVCVVSCHIITIFLDEENLFLLLPTLPFAPVVTCPRLDDPVNGVASPPSRSVYQSVTNFSCNSGYTLNGSSSRTCQSDGNWDGTNTNCTGKNFLRLRGCCLKEYMSKNNTFGTLPDSRGEGAQGRQMSPLLIRLLFRFVDRVL